MEESCQHFFVGTKFFQKLRKFFLHAHKKERGLWKEGSKQALDFEIDLSTKKSDRKNLNF